MTRTLTLLTLAAAAALAGCNNQDNTIQAGPADPMADELANAAPVELPPAIAASKIYRCKDNSVVYIDWLSDNKSANFRSDKSATPVQLRAPEAGQPLVADGGYSLTGSATDATVMLAIPGKPAQSCKA